MDDANIDKKTVSNTVSNKRSYNYFVGYKDDEKVIPSCIMFPQIRARAKYFDETKCMCFLIEHNELLEKYNKICDKISYSIKIDFDSKSDKSL